MNVTVREVLENAEYNEKGQLPFQREMAANQRENYNIAKELGANDEDDWSDWEEKVIEYKNKKN